MANTIHAHIKPSQTLHAQEIGLISSWLLGYVFSTLFSEHLLSEMNYFLKQKL